MRDTPILTQRRKNCILVKTNLEKSFILGLLFVFQLTVSLLYRIQKNTLQMRNRVVILLQVLENVFLTCIFRKRKGDNMMQRKIKLRLDEVEEFVSAASRCNFDIDIFYNRYTVDAKSIVGVLGLDLTQTLTVSYNGYDDHFEKILNQLSLAS